MGKVLSVVARKARRFNVENRAHKVISMEKPIVAPKHPASQREIDMMMKDHGGAFEELKRKDTKLDENLKQVYVTSTKADMTKFGKPSDKSRLPANRLNPLDSELGYDEPEIVPIGKITLKQAMKVLTNKLATPESVTAEKIANALNISTKDAENLVNYFSSLKLYMPETVPQLSASQKAKKILIRQMSQTKVETLESTPSTLRLENSPTRIKPD